MSGPSRIIQKRKMSLSMKKKERERESEKEREGAHGRESAKTSAKENDS